MQKKIRVLMVEDYSLIRVSLKAIFEEHPNIDVVGEAENGKIAIKLADELKPDVVLMDIGLPEMDGIQATRKIKEMYPNMKVIILTSHEDETEVNQALEAGANAYAMKDIRTEYLIMVIQSVNEGAVWIDPAVAPLVKAKQNQKTES